MCQLLLLSFLALLFSVTGEPVNTDDLCNRREVVQGCSLENGHALCESWNLSSSINELPSCTKRITFSLLADPSLINKTRLVKTNLHDANFSNLPSLHEFSIEANRKNYPFVRLLVAGSPTFEYLPKVTNLRMSVKQYLVSPYDDYMFRFLKTLSVLDLSRSHLGLSAASRLIRQVSLMRTLILKNAQEIDNGFLYASSVDLSHFICVGKLNHLDLNYNYIVSVSLSKMCWTGRLRYLNMEHNFLASTSDQASGLTVYFEAMSVVSGLEVFKGNILTDATFQEGLWDDEHILDYVNEDNDQEMSLLSKLLLGTPAVRFLVGYEFWLADAMKHCGNISFPDVARCTTKVQDGLCSFLKCVTPEFDIQNCPVENVGLQLEYFSKTKCSYKQCANNMPLPLPPRLKSFTMSNALKYTTSTMSLNPQDLVQTFCFHENNDLEFVDLPSFNAYVPQNLTGHYNIYGLKKLRFLNLQGHRLPVPMSHVVFHDMESLAELHVGGNSIAYDNILPSDFLRTYTKLSILNLSSAYLVKIEPDVFVNSTNLSMLDLSHNQLNSSTLSLIDWSQTRMKSLNLSHNVLTDIPSSMRDQLDQMDGLELYLSGNTFICNCENLEFLQWIQSNSTNTVHSSEDHVCTNSPGNTIHDIKIDSLRCNWYWMQPVIAVASAVALKLLCLAAFGIYKKRYFISNLIFRLQERFMRPSNEPQQVFKYDAFVLYSSIEADRLFVHFKLVSELEKNFGFRLCIHHRDFLGGCDIADCIEQAIRTSRKVLVIMSENFLRSEWCIEEVHMTSSIDRKKFIVIMYKDVLLSDAPIPPVVQHLLTSKTYIEWAEAPEAQELFWKKLRRALYSKQKVSSDLTQTTYNNESYLL